MIIFSRKIVISKSYDEVYNCIKSFAHCVPKGRFNETDFSMRCSKRYGGGNIYLIHISGIIIPYHQMSYIYIFTHADLVFFLGCILCILGVAGLIGCILSYFTRIYSSIGLMIIGLIILIQSISTQKSVIDRLEKKLCNL